MSHPLRFNLALIVLTVLCGTFAYIVIPAEGAKNNGTQLIASPFCATVGSSNIRLEGTSAYAIDIATGTTLYEKNASQQLPLASLTKLMTVLTVSEILKPNYIVTISNDALKPEGDVGFERGEKWTLQDLIDYTLVISANDGARALALAAEDKLGETDEQFIRRMNEKAVKIGMKETFFMDETGLDISKNTAGAYGSARDVAELMRHITLTNPRLIEATTVGSGVFVSETGIRHKGTNTSDVITNLSGAIGSKTGFTDLAGGNLAVVFEPIPGRPVVAVILGSSRSGRDTDMQRLTEQVRKTLRVSIICAEASDSSHNAL